MSGARGTSRAFLFPIQGTGRERERKSERPIKGREGSSKEDTVGLLPSFADSLSLQRVRGKFADEEKEEKGKREGRKWDAVLYCGVRALWIRGTGYTLCVCLLIIRDERKEGKTILANLRKPRRGKLHRQREGRESFADRYLVFLLPLTIRWRERGTISLTPYLRSPLSFLDRV